MKITFVQSDGEMDAVDRVIREGLSLKEPRRGTWVVPPSLSKASGMFTVVDSQDGKNVFVESFRTLDGAMLYALGVRDDVDDAPDGTTWDVHDAVKDVNGGNFV
jgi:hypothetical protein